MRRRRLPKFDAFCKTFRLKRNYQICYTLHGVSVRRCHPAQRLSRAWRQIQSQFGCVTKLAVKGVAVAERLAPSISGKSSATLFKSAGVAGYSQRFLISGEENVPLISAALTARSRT